MIPEIAIIAALFVITWIFILIIGISIVNKSSDDLLALDQRLGEAISELVKEILSSAGDFEAPNPIQLMIARLIESKIDNPTATVEVLPRSSDGKFSSDSS